MFEYKDINLKEGSTYNLESINIFKITLQHHV